MKKVLSQKQLENMIAECVGQVMTEARQSKEKKVVAESKKPARKFMNEAQLHEYIQNIINEEMENEGLWDFAKGMGGFLGGKAKNAVGNAANAAGQAIGGAAQKVGKAAQGAYNSAKTAVGNGVQGVQQFGQQAMQAGKNASAAADTAKLVQQIDGLYQKYGKTLTKSQMASIRSAKSALNQLCQAFGSGDVNA